jgi:hypothetical protein
MIRNILILAGAFLSGALGYFIFKVTGLFDACESSWLQYVMSSAFILIFLSSFRSGFLNNRPVDSKSSYEEEVEEEYTESPALDAAS